MVLLVSQTSFQWWLIAECQHRGIHTSQSTETVSLCSRDGESVFEIVVFVSVYLQSDLLSSNGVTPLHNALFVMAFFWNEVQSHMMRIHEVVELRARVHSLHVQA